MTIGCTVRLFAIAAQKPSLALSVCDIVAWYRSRLDKLNCGNGCLRFRHPDGIPFDVIEDILRESMEKRRGQTPSPDSPSRAVEPKAPDSASQTTVTSESQASKR
jgi:hypothetical protein